MRLKYQEISLTEEQNAAEPAIVKSLLRAAPAEQQLLLHWARGLGVIRQGDLPAHKKVAAVFGLTRDRKATWPLVKLIARTLKHIAWDARSWKFRLSIGAIIATLAAVGNAGADIVALGGGIGLPLWILMGVVGAVVGKLIDLAKKKFAGPKAA